MQVYRIIAIIIAHGYVFCFLECICVLTVFSCKLTALSSKCIFSYIAILSRFNLKETKDEQWKRAMDYLNFVNELNYMTQIVIMLYEDPNKASACLCAA